MSDFYLATDATIDLTQELVDELGLKVIPMNFTLGKDEYKHYPDGRELSYEEFYRRLSEGEDASTSQISPIMYEEFFEPMLKEGKDVVYVCLSSGLSGTYNVSQMVATEMKAKYPERRVVAIDSLDASIGEGLLVLLAARKMQEGASFDEVVDFLNDNRLKIDHCFMVEDLNQLKRGGRISSFEAVLGSALSIHPILSIDPQGKLKVIAKMRGIKKSIHFLKDYTQQMAFKPEHQTIVVGHASAPDVAKELADELASAGLCKEYFITDIGPVIGSHVGKGMCAVVFLLKEERK